MTITADAHRYLENSFTELLNQGLIPNLAIVGLEITEINHIEEDEYRISWVGETAQESKLRKGRDFIRFTPQENLVEDVRWSNP